MALHFIVRIQTKVKTNIVHYYVLEDKNNMVEGACLRRLLPNVWLYQAVGLIVLKRSFSFQIRVRSRNQNLRLYIMLKLESDVKFSTPKKDGYSLELASLSGCIIIIQQD